MGARWTYGVARCTNQPGLDGARCGWFWNSWGVVGGKGRWTVYHRPSGTLLTTFQGDRLEPRRIAKAFCEEIDGLTDWTTPTPDDDPDIYRQIHQIALRLTNSRPALQLIAGGAS
jgi:hypothetical protein